LIECDEWIGSFVIAGRLTWCQESTDTVSDCQVCFESRAEHTQQACRTQLVILG